MSDKGQSNHSKSQKPSEQQKPTTTAPVTQSPLRYSQFPVQYSQYQPQYLPTQQFSQPMWQPPIVQSVVQQPMPVMTQPVQQSIRGESRIEYVPYEKKVIEYEDEVRTVKVPREKVVTDYYPVEYETEYIPQVTYDKVVEYVPQERLQERIEYQAVERQVQRQQVVQQPVVVQQPIVQSVVQQPVQYRTQAPIRTSYVPQQRFGSFSGFRPQVSRLPTTGATRPGVNKPQTKPKQKEDGFFETIFG